MPDTRSGCRCCSRSAGGGSGGLTEVDAIFRLPRLILGSRSSWRSLSCLACRGREAFWWRRSGRSTPRRRWRRARWFRCVCADAQGRGRYCQCAMSNVCRFRGPQSCSRQHFDPVAADASIARSYRQSREAETEVEFRRWGWEATVDGWMDVLQYRSVRAGDVSCCARQLSRGASAGR